MPAKKRKTTRSSTRTQSKSSTRGRKSGASAKTRGGKQSADYDLPNNFWRQLTAVLMIILALFFVITWFGQDETILNTIHKYLQQGIGFSAYWVPILLVYLGVRILRTENNRLPVPVYFASIFMLLWFAGIGATAGNGGVAGDWLNTQAVKLVGEGPVVIVYIVLIFITTLFMLQISPVALFKRERPANAEQEPEKEKPTKTKQDTKLGQLEIKVNSDLDETSDEKPAKKLHRGLFSRASKKQLKEEKPELAAAPISAPKEEKTLVVPSDPDWKFPSTSLLTKKQSPADPGNTGQNAMIIKNTFSEFGIEVEMEGANVGPRVTQYTLKAPGGVNLAKIAARDKELAYKLSAQTVRIEAPIPGTQLIGVEVPNIRSATVSFRNLIESDEWKKDRKPLSFVIGKNISGKPIVANLPDMRHLLIAGTTGSGKSVMTNTLIMSLIFSNSPSDVRMIIVDPKQVEMAAYRDIPHLLTPVITDTTKAFSALKWAANEMDRRYRLMADCGVKQIGDYNDLMAKNKDKEGENAGAKMPYIVIVIDEMSDLMMQAGKELEPLIVRIAQLGRAAGMHLVLATQKPIVKVITGLIKGNIPSRISFRVLTSMESRIILDLSGAEKLLGQGDMLLSTEKTMNGPERIQGAWTPDEDIKKVTDFLREQRPPDYNDEVIAQTVAIKGLGGGGGGDMDGMGRSFDPNDPLVRKAVELCIANGKFSTGMLQTRLSKGHGWVSGLGFWLEDIGVVGPTQGTKPRELLISSMEQFNELANV